MLFRISSSFSWLMESNDFLMSTLTMYTLDLELDRGAVIKLTRTHLAMKRAFTCAPNTLIRTDRPWRMSRVFFWLVWCDWIGRWSLMPNGHAEMTLAPFHNQEPVSDFWDAGWLSLYSKIPFHSPSFWFENSCLWVKNQPALGTRYVISAQLTVLGDFRLKLVIGRRSFSLGRNRIAAYGLVHAVASAWEEKCICMGHHSKEKVVRTIFY